MLKLRNQIIRCFIVVLVLAGCSSAGDRLNEKLVNQITEQRLVTLQNECFSVSDKYHGTPLPEGQPQKYLLSKICGDMGAQIAQASNHKTKGQVSPDDFQKLYDSCVKESDIYGSSFGGRHNHSTNHYQYHIQTEAICNAYRDMFTELAGDVLPE